MTNDIEKQLSNPKQSEGVGDVGEVIKWLDDAFADIADSRERLGKSNDVLDRCERVLNKIRALTLAQEAEQLRKERDEWMEKYYALLRTFGKESE